MNEKAKIFDELFDPFLKAYTLRVMRSADCGVGGVTREIDRFNKSNGNKPTYSIDEDYVTRNFPNATNPLVYGKKYQVFLIPIKGKDVTYQQCLDYMASNKFIFAGTSAYPLLKRDSDLTKKLPRGKWLMSLDVEKNCYNKKWARDESDLIFHCMKIHEDKGVDILPSMCKSTFDSNYILIGFKELEEL